MLSPPSSYSTKISQNHHEFIENSATRNGPCVYNYITLYKQSVLYIAEKITLTARSNF